MIGRSIGDPFRYLLTAVDGTCILNLFSLSCPVPDVETGQLT
jgi:hypothetical protein